MARAAPECPGPGALAPPLSAARVWRRRTSSSRNKSASAISARGVLPARPGRLVKLGERVVIFPHVRRAPTRARRARFTSFGCMLRYVREFRRRFVEMLLGDQASRKAQMRRSHIWAHLGPPRGIPAPPRSVGLQLSSARPSANRILKSVPSRPLGGPILFDRLGNLPLRSPRPCRGGIWAPAWFGISSAAFCRGATAAAGSLSISVKPEIQIRRRHFRDRGK